MTSTTAGMYPLHEVDVTDDQGVTVTCPKTALTVGETMTCTASGTAQDGIDYTNIGTADGYSPIDTPVTASEPDCYNADQLPPPPGCIEICKSVDGTNPDPAKTFTVCVDTTNCRHHRWNLCGL